MKLPATPNLFRAVAECTQPYGPPASGSAVRLLQSYLTNERCVDSVYKAVLARAVAEPQSELVIAKCIALIKQYVSRYPPSAAVLEAIAVACQHLAASLDSSDLQKSLLYLESSVVRLAGSTTAGRRLGHVPSRSTGSTSSRPWLQAAANGDAGSQSMHSSASAEDLQARLVAGSPIRASLEDPHQQQKQSQNYAADGSAGFAPLRHPEQRHQVSDSSDEQHAALSAVREVGQEGGLPSWTFQPSALQDLWCHQPDSDVADLDWSMMLPQYSPSLVPLVEGLPGMEVLLMLSSQDIIDATTDSDVPTQIRQMREIVEVRRVQQGLTPEVLQQALRQSSTSTARRLFQPLPYTHQDPMEMTSTDIAAVVEILCGKPSPAIPSAITGTVGLDDPSIYWQPRQQQQQQQEQQPLLMLYQQAGQQQQTHTESIGQISSCILMKLVIDLWLTAGGSTAYPLVLRMLQQALYQSQPEYRATAFDIIYNLSLHGVMLMPCQMLEPGSPTIHRKQGSQGAAGGHSSSIKQALQPDMYQSDMLQRLQAGHTRTGSAGYGLTAAGGTEANPRSPHSAISGGTRESVDDSPMKQDRTAHNGRSPPGSPKIHLPPQLLAPPSPPAYAQQAGPAEQPSNSSSPLSSPRVRSRLSRSNLQVIAEQQDRRSGGSLRTSGGGAVQTAQVAVEAAVIAGSPNSNAAGVEDDNKLGGSAGNPSLGLAWEAWLQQLLYELMLMLAQLEESNEQVWQSAVGCLLHLTTHAGHWVASSLSSLPPAAAAAMLNASVKFNWSQELHSRLVQMAVNLLYVTDPSPPLCPAAFADTVQQGSRVKSPGRWRQQQQLQDKAAMAQRESDCAQPDVQEHLTADAECPARNLAKSRSMNREPDPCRSHSSSPTADDVKSAGMSELDLPCQLHAGPVDEQQLAAFGGAGQLLRHFCQAGSIEAQRTLLVPLLQVLMPHDAPDASQLAILQVLCSSPTCLAALQATTSAGLSGWSGPVLAAITQLQDDSGLDLQLLATLLQRLEDLGQRQLHVAAAGLQSDQQLHGQAAGDLSREPSSASSSLASAIPREVEVAMQVTLRQLAGQLPAQPQIRTGSQAADSVVYQLPPEVLGSWKALKALCWCDDESARCVARHWLQQLMAVTLQQALKNAILLPLPGVTQRPSTPTADASNSSSTVNRNTIVASLADIATAAAVNAACDAWVEVLQQLVTHCPQGPNTLVDALQLHIARCRMQLDDDMAPAQTAAQASPDKSKAAPCDGVQQQQKQRAAVARMCVQAWAFVCQWVMQASISNSHAALTRLAGIAQSLACVPDVPEWAAEVEPASTAFAQPVSDSVESTPSISNDDATAVTRDDGQAKPAPASEASDPALHALPPQTAAAAAASTSAAGSTDPDAAYRGVPPPEPSSEPSALADMLAEEAQDSAVIEQHGYCSHQQMDAAGAVAAEAVCWPQAFLLGRTLLPQQMAQVLAGSSLALLLVRLLQCKQPSRAADRGFHGRPCSSSRLTRGSNDDGHTGLLPCPVLYPWSDGRHDLQLGLLLVLMSSCGDEADNFASFGMEAVTQQVLTRCTDARACLFVSQFMLDHLMRHQQERYWSALRQLVATAQQQDDERLLGNPFLQLVTLLSQQTKQQGPSSLAASPQQGTAVAAGSGGRGGKLA